MNAPLVNPTPIRIPMGLRDWLKHQAIDNRRTLSSEIVYRLDQSRVQQQAQAGKAGGQ